MTPGIFHPDAIHIPADRRAMQDDAVVRLMDSIQRIGLQTPPTVRWSDDVEDGPVLVTGRHRVEACRRLGWDNMPVLVMEGTADEARMWEISENLHRAELNEVEKAESIEEWKSLKAKSDADVSSESGKGGSHASHLNAQPKEAGVRATARELGISRAAVQRAAKIASLPDAIKNQGRAENWSARRLLDAAQTDEQKAKKAADQQVAETEVEYFAEWLHRRVDPGELPMLISWLEGCPGKSVIKALRRLAA